MLAPFGHSPATAQADPPEELPSGTSAAFRERLLDWTARTTHGATMRAETVMPAGISGGSSSAPVPRLSSGFGYRTNPVLRRRMLHSGIDIPGPLGTAVLASDSGVVHFAGAANGYGLMIEIGHANGMASRYAHLSRILVSSGMPVRHGERIGLMGSTGRSTGSHLHFEIRAGGQPVDPLPLLRRGGPLSAPGGNFHMVADRAPHVSQFAQARDFAGGRALGF